MAKLVIEFCGMALIGHGIRGEAWLIDTDRVRVGHHTHAHWIRRGSEPKRMLKNGDLVTFESDGSTLGGPLDLRNELKELVDLDAFLSDARLRDELQDENPRPGGRWSDFVATWIRLPSGGAEAMPKASEIWDFRNGTSRTLTERFSITVENVTEPHVRIRSSADPEGMLLPIPRVAEDYPVYIDTLYNGPELPRPKPGDRVELDEIQLITACVIARNPLDAIPSRVYSAEDIRGLSARRRFSDPITICPTGGKRFP